MLANPFAGVKIKSQVQRAGLDVSRGFSEGEWLLIRTLADGLEWSYGWSEAAAQRLRFLLDSRSGCHPLRDPHRSPERWMSNSNS